MKYYYFIKKREGKKQSNAELFGLALSLEDIEPTKPIGDVVIDCLKKSNDMLVIFPEQELLEKVSNFVEKEDEVYSIEEFCNQKLQDLQHDLIKKCDKEVTIEDIYDVCKDRTNELRTCLDAEKKLKQMQNNDDNKVENESFQKYPKSSPVPTTSPNQSNSNYIPANNLDINDDMLVDEKSDNEKQSRKPKPKKKLSEISSNADVDGSGNSRISALPKERGKNVIILDESDQDDMFDLNDELFENGKKSKNKNKNKEKEKNKSKDKDKKKKKKNNEDNDNDIDVMMENDPNGIPPKKKRQSKKISSQTHNTVVDDEDLADKNAKELEIDNNDNVANSQSLTRNNRRGRKTVQYKTNWG